MAAKIPIFSMEKKKLSERSLPVQFSEAYRPDLIRRAVVALQSAARQKYGTFLEAGQRHSAETSKRRHDYRGTYGQGISRVKRKILSRRGSRMGWVGALTPQTRGGRRAHPPRAEKNFEKKLNKKENFTLILISHDLSVVHKFATGVLCLNKKAVCAGKPDVAASPEVLRELYGKEKAIYKHHHG